MTGSDAVPERLGGYELVRKLSSGGMGSVFLAEKRSTHGFHKRVAVKVILPELLADEESRSLFFHEARLAARLQHPNLVQVFDFGEDEGVHYLVMEYLDGASTAALLRASTPSAPDGLLDPYISARLVAEAARGLAWAHNLKDDAGRHLGIVHRDISPDNIFITRSGDVKVLDFGIARSRESQTMTFVGTVRGKAAYLAPERVREEPIDSRADVWSLGVVFYELLAGRRLFRGGAGATSVMRAVLSQPIDPVGPSLLADIVLAMLSRDVEQRPYADEVVRRLEHAFAQSRTVPSAEDLAAALAVRVLEVHTSPTAKVSSAERSADEDNPDEATGNEAVPDDDVLATARASPVVPRDHGVATARIQATMRRDASAPSPPSPAMNVAEPAPAHTKVPRDAATTHVPANVPAHAAAHAAVDTAFAAADTLWVDAPAPSVPAHPTPHAGGVPRVRLVAAAASLVVIIVGVGLWGVMETRSPPPHVTRSVGPHAPLPEPTAAPSAATPPSPTAVAGPVTPPAEPSTGPEPTAPTPHEVVAPSLKPVSAADLAGPPRDASSPVRTREREPSKQRQSESGSAAPAGFFVADRTPYVDVIVDGRKVGISPLGSARKPHTISAGPHTIELVDPASGDVVTTRQVVLSPGQVVDIQ